jgi:hypothetical protein
MEATELLTMIFRRGTSLTKLMLVDAELFVVADYW